MIEFTTGLLMLASAFAPSTSSVDKTSEKATVVPAQATTTVQEIIIPLVRDEKSLTIPEVESIVREYFQDTPILAEIARCESSFRQYNGKTGEVLTGKVNSGDIGVMQINKHYHEEDAEKLGLNIYTLEGNLEFAKVLYGKYGSKPWKASSPCWGNTHDTSQIAMN